MARGRLRIYLGAAPGVGKTYEMLMEGHRRAQQGADCVIGFVEPHGRRATAALVEGLEVVPRRLMPYRGAELPEMDLDAVLARQPQVALVDELAHTNAPGSRHAKRWQDVEDLLDAGIDVVSTLNIQHLESLNDVVAEMTGVRQRETLPDAVARRADELELVDLSPEALRRRMVAGDIYPADRIDAALTHFFRPGNLTGLRELALLWLADRVDEGLRQYRAQHGIAAPWEARERVIVAVSGGPESDRLIRRAARIVTRTPGSDLMAVYVARSDGLPGPDAATLGRYRALTESLGGSWHQVIGMNVADALGHFARYENATQLVVGASRGSRLSAFLSGREAVARRIARLGGFLDVHVVIDETPAARPPFRLLRPGSLSRRRQLAALVTLMVLLPAMTAVLAPLRSQLALSADLLAYLLAVVVVALIGGLYPALLAALMSAVLADFYFTRPVHSFVVAAVSDVVALVVYVTTALLVSWAVELAARGQRLATRTSAEATAMTAMAEAVLHGQGDPPRLLELMRETFGLDAVSLLERPDTGAPGETGWFVSASSGDRPPERPEEASAEVMLGPSLVLAGRGRALPPPDLEIFHACAAQVAEVFRERRLAEQAASAVEQAGGERQRAALAAAAGHLLSGPVAAARQSLGSLRSLSPEPGPEQKALIDHAEHAVDRVGLLAQQLTDLARARAGALDVHLSPVDLADVVATALEELGPGRRGLDVRIPDDLPDVIADAAVLRRIVIALAANAVRRSPSGSAPVLTAAPSGDRVEIRFEDRGPPPEGPVTGVAAGAPGYFAGPPPWHGAFSIGVAHDLAEAINGSLDTTQRTGGGLAVTVSLASAAGS